MRQKKGVFLFFLVCCWLIYQPFKLSALRPGKSVEDYLIRVWNIEDGLPQNSILSLIQSREGYIWFGTQSGLVRFDGVNLSIFNRWNIPTLKNDRILSLFEDQEGTLWIGTDGAGLAGMREGHWTAYTTAEGLSNDHVRVIMGDRLGNLWVGTNYGLNLLKDGKFKIYTIEHGLSGNAVQAVAEDRQGNLWVGTDGSGLNIMKDGRFQAVQIADRASPKEISAIHEDRSGVLWLGTEVGLYCLDQGRFRDYGPGIGMPAEPIRVIAEDNEGTLWIGTDGSGLFSLRHGVLGSLTTENGFLDDYIYSITEDHEGSLWIGTYTSGLIQLQEKKVASITSMNGLPGNVIYAVLEDSQGCLWAGTRDKGLCKIKDNRVIQILSRNEGLADNHIRAICQDRDGSLWIGTAGRGLNRLQDGKLIRFTTSDGLSADTVNIIFLDSAGIIWIGTPRGLNRFKGGKFSSFGLDSELPDFHQYINVIYETSSGHLLVGTKGGLLAFGNGDLRPFFTSKPDDGKGEFDQEVLAIYEDKANNLWIGTRGSGLLGWRQGKLTHYDTSLGLYNNYIFGILEDQRDNLWISSYRGVFRVARIELEQFADNQIKSITCISFDEREGMKSSECTSGGHPAAWKTSKEKLCFATVKGISIFDPATIKTNTLPPPVIIEGVFADNESILGEEKPVLSAEKRMFEFYFTALSFKAPEKVRFKYKIEGLDQEWIGADPLQKRAALYLNLKPGKYCFQVIASNNHGIWNRQGTNFSFEIKTPFSKTAIFYILLTIILLFGAAGAAWFIYFRRVRLKTKKYKTSALDAETAEQVLPKLLHLVEQEQVYLDPNLTLKKLSERLMIHYNYLSQIINEKLGHSFNDFINKYRIEEAQRKLLDPRQGQKNVLEIAYDTGFYSKSVFNTAFKKFTGMTPSEFKKKHRSR